MMHLDQEQIQRLIHGELVPAMAASVHDHLAACFDCRSRVAEAREEEATVLALLEHLDHAKPALSIESVIKPERSRGTSWGGWAAGILLALGIAGAAYAIPGLPIRGWVDSLVKSVSQRDEPSLTVPAPTATAAISGIVIDPGAELAIVFANRVEGSARVMLTNDSDVTVRALNGTATFTSDIDRLLIDDVSATGFEIRIPRAARHVEILIGSHRVFLSERSRVASETPADASGSYVVPLPAAR
jgi:anti-sigma factor RsiW